MGVGYPLDIVICVALGVDMFDCVYPCRTARFGTALVRSGQLRLTSAEFASDYRPTIICIQPTTFTEFSLSFSLNEVHWFRSCIQQQSLPRPLEPGGKGPLKEYSRAMLHSIVTKEPVAAQLITWHNLWFMLNLLTESWMHHLDACSQRSQGPQFLIFVIQSFILSFCLTVVCAVPQDLRSVRLRAWFIKKTQKSESHPNTECQEMREAIKANTFHEPWYVLSPASFLLLSFFIRRASVCWKEVAWHLVGVRLPSFWKIQLASASLCQAVLKPFAWCSECNASVTCFIHGGFRGFTVSNHRQEHTISIHFIRVGHSRQCRIGCDNF